MQFPMATVKKNALDTYLLEFLLYFTQQFSNKRILNKITMPHQIDVSKLFAEK
jgi:hypothetical protein